LQFLNSITFYGHLFYTGDPEGEDDFTRWQKEINQAETEAQDDGLGGVGEAGPDDRPATPPEGEEEFTDDDGTIYKWDRKLRAWVPQVSFNLTFIINICISLMSGCLQTLI
jgi:hypothetical protein